ncbi:hypothetical protein EV1_000646 [Malus domestica]
MRRFRDGTCCILCLALTVSVCESATKGGILHSLTRNLMFFTLSVHNCNSVNTANSFPFTDPSSITSTIASLSFDVGNRIPDVISDQAPHR